MNALVRGLPAMLFGVCCILFAVAVGVPLAFAQETEQGADGESTVRDASPKAALSTTGSNEPFTVAPVVANEKAKPRDIIKKELVLTNHTTQRQDLYITVENIDPASGAQAFVAPGASDLSTSLANWIEITRGVIKLGPGESRKIPYLIHVNLTAKPGSYFARIGVTRGADRAYAEDIEPDVSLVLNLEVLDDAHERLTLGKFTSDDSVVLGGSVGFSYLLENVGNRVIEPRGSIRIFNRRGEEVGSIPLNANGEEITPENTRQLAALWSAEGRFGKYKAFLDLEYGESQLASVQDTLYFWVFPWKEILATLIGVFVLGAAGTFIVHMRTLARPSPVRASVRREDPVALEYDETVRYAPVHQQQPSYAPGGPTIISRRTTGQGTHVRGTGSGSSSPAGVHLPSRHARPGVAGATVQLARRR